MRPLNSPPRPGRPDRVPVLPRGPKLYSQRPIRIVGPGNPPEGFVIGTTSATEWYVYWGLWQVFREPGDVRKPPYLGSPTGRWSFQLFVNGGRHVRGGSVIDFVINASIGTAIGIRVQTERYHIFVDSKVKAYDRMQVTNIPDGMDVKDIYEQDFISDASGRSVILLLKDIIAGIAIPDPSLSGMARREKRL